MSSDKLASFRVDSQLWEQFQSYAKQNNLTATALLVTYIKSVVNTGNSVNTVSQDINTTNENKPSLSIQDINDCIDDKLRNINTLSIQDIDDRIKLSVQDGDIGGAIANCYKDAMGQFDGLLQELQALQRQIEELKSIPPVNQQLTTDNQQPTTDNQQPTIDHQQLTPDNQQLTTDNQQLTNEQIIQMLGINEIIENKENEDFKIYLEWLEEQGIPQNMANHRVAIERSLNLKIDLKKILGSLKTILESMGYKCHYSRNRVAKMTNKVSVDITSYSYFTLL